MSESITLARPYAKAAFGFALENNAIESWHTMLSFVSQVCEDDQIKKRLLERDYSDRLADLLIAICKGQIDKYFINFIKIMAKNKRLMLLPSVAALYMEYRLLHESVANVTVLSADDLSERQLLKIKSVMEKRLQKSVNINKIIDKSIIYGFIIQVDDMVIDNSIKARLERLKDTLQS